MTASREFLEELLAECLERREQGGDAAVEEFLQEHPGCAPALRRYLAFLGDSNPSAKFEAIEIDEVEVGREIGDFRLIRPIGRGAMGEVWLAEQVSLLRRCALKLVDLRAISANARARFRLEARALARVESSHVVRVIASGEFEDIGYLAMDLVEGQGLDELLQAEPGPVLAEIVRHGRDVARALAAVHDAGLVHRDLKPSNIRINEAGEAVLIDFGLARDLRAGAAGLSMSGAFIGTPCYAAPEQLTGDDQDIGPWTDVYGLGVSLYECIAGERPFKGKTPEQVFRQILMAEPEPLRNLQPSASSDLATVITKSMEKEPSRRYRSATELAQDLQAVLELRPISAQPAGTLRRMRRWTRRHRLTSGVILALALGLLLVVATVTIEGMKARQDRAQRANDLVADAVLALERFRLTQSEVELALRRRNEIVRLMPYRHLAVEEVRELDELEADLEANEGQRQELFFDMLESLRRAEDLDAEVPRLEETRAAVYLEQWRLAVAAGSNGLARFYGERVRASDRSGRFETELAGETRLVVKVHPRDAEVHLFRILPEHELDGKKEFRNVALPFGQALGARPTVTTDGTPRPGQTCLRVLRGAKGIETDALITAVDGFPPLSSEAPPWRRIAELQPILTVYQRGRSEEVRAPVGLTLRPTANPLVPSADSLLRNPLAGESIRSGIWLLLVRSAGHASRRHLLTIAADTPAKIEIDLELDQAKLVPAGFVRLQELRPTSQQEPRWMLDHEVTCGDYLEFLNDEITRARIEAAPTAILFPRTATNVEDGGYWTRDEHGRYQLGPGWTADMPVLGVSHEDATAYVAWKEEQLDEEGYDLDLRLPEQYDYICSSSPAQRYVWGDRFRPHWSKSCHATEKPQVEEVLSYPIDESLGGHFDLAGSAQEWCEPWFAREQNERMLHGGSWAHARAERFVIDFVAGSPPDHAADTFGFRIVARPRP